MHIGGFHAHLAAIWGWGGVHQLQQRTPYRLRQREQQQRFRCFCPEALQLCTQPSNLAASKRLHVTDKLIEQQQQHVANWLSNLSLQQAAY